MRRNQFAAVVLAILLFASGVAVGALAHRYYAVRTVNAHTRDSFRARYLSEMRSRLNLTPQQVQQLQRVMDETKAQFRTLHESSRPQMEAIKREHVQKVRALLTPQQQPIYDQIVAEHEQRAREDEKQRDR
jgi:Spy/CpxP family protein refolding chaperone